MRDIRIGAAQFEHRDGDKAYNLSRIEALARKAVEQGAEIVSFHECSIPGYTWLQTLDSAGLALVSESVPDGPSTRALVSIAKRHRIIVMAGLIEAAPDGRSYNSYVTVGPDGFITRFHKLHPFIHPDLAPGGGYQVIELAGCKVGFLICYDLNLPENARITALMGAEIIFMPHVTGCLASPMPGRGTVDKALWDNRERDPVRLRMELEGPKNRGWLMRFLPCRCWENGVYGIFSNPIGVDHDTIKGGNAMIIDPFGEVVAESRTLGDDVVVGLLAPEKREQASGKRYLRARRPELYGRLVEPAAEPPVTLPGWTRSFDKT
jgi:predicted amidohydrolase